MIQGYDPRTGEPVGEPVAETTDAEVDAIAAAAAAAFPAWGSDAAMPGRAAALDAVADALDDRAGELAAIADTETALGGERLIGEVARTTTQLRLFAGVLRDGGYLDSAFTAAEGVVDAWPNATVFACATPSARMCPMCPRPPATANCSAPRSISSPLSSRNRGWSHFFMSAAAAMAASPPVTSMCWIRSHLPARCFTSGC
jgi:hypothetical protein